MKMIKPFIIVLGATLFNGCSPKDVSPKVVSIEYNPLIWKVKRDRNELASKNFFYHNSIIQGIESSEAGFKLLALSSDSGKIIWENTDWPGKLNPWPHECSAIQDNILLLTRHKTLMAVELDSGKTLWTATLENPSVSGVKIIDGWAYKSDEYPNGRYSAMMRFNIHTGVKEEVFRITRKEHGDNLYAPNLKLPVKWTAPNGNELLIMHNRSYGRGTTEKDRMDILAFNITNKALEWYRKGLDESSSSSGAAISDDKVYFYGTWHAYCIDAATGNTNWKYDVGISSGGDFNTANILLIDDKLIVKQENYKMTAVDKETGSKIWHNPITAPSPHLLTAHNDTIWMASGGLLAIDAHSGKVLFNWNNGGKGWWSNPVLPHPTNGYIYTTDGNYMYCIDPKHLR